MTKEDLDKHVKILGWIHIVLNAFLFVIGMMVVAFMLFGGLLSGDAEAAGIIVIVALFVGGLFTVIGIPGVLAGVGLLKRKKWGRILAIIVGLIGITNIPIGTAVGAYTIYVLLLQDNAPAYFD